MSDEDPGFGPGGYLPDRAARRARKIMLRAPLGLQWIIASAIAGVVVLVAGLLFLRSADEPPGDPFVAAADDAAVDPALEVEGLGVLLVRGGRLRAFPIGDRGIVWCPQSDSIESASGRVWSPTGRALDGGESLASHPTVVHDGTVYVDPTRLEDGPPGTRAGNADPACT
ncbi:MAG: hypothetical protein KY469_02780 [Actinobacteria bacterium]|nr:hypothetical protein [Actinomycetota bacterium]